MLRCERCGLSDMHTPDTAPYPWWCHRCQAWCVWSVKEDGAKIKADNASRPYAGTHVRVTNDVHGTAATVYVAKDGTISSGQMRGLLRRLCGRSGCGCNMENLQLSRFHRVRSKRAGVRYVVLDVSL